MSASRPRWPRATPPAIHLHLHTQQSCPSARQNTSAGGLRPSVLSSSLLFPPIVLSTVISPDLHGAVNMPRRRRGRPTSSSGSGTIDQLSPFATDSESDRGYGTELTEPDSDAPCDRRKVKRRRRRLRYKPNTPVPKGAAVSVTDDSDDDTDPEDDTDDEILSEDEDDDYAFGTRNNIARLEDHWQRLRRLAKKHGLDTQEKEKDPAYVEDTSTLQKTALRTQEKRFWLGLQRMQICLYNLLGLFTLNRKSAILNLRFKDLRVSLQRDPSGGPDLPTVEFSYEFTKKHLGLTQTNTFTLPEIIYEPSLILSPHIFLFGILFFFEAFSPPSLTSMAKLRGLKIGGGRQQLLIPLKPEMANHYVFCKVAKVNGEIRIFPQEMMDPSSSVRTIAEIAGFLHSWFNHRCRYGGGLILNKSGLVGDAEQNLVLKHANIRTFLEHYIPRNVCLNMQALISGLDPNSPLMRAITRIGRFLDKRRPRHLTDAQKAIVEQDPELQEAIQKRDRVERRAAQTNDPVTIEKLGKLRADVEKTRRRLLYKYRKRVREEFDDEQAVIDIERQLSGEAVDEEAKETLRDEQLLPQMIYLFSKLLTWPTSRSVEVELRRRDAGADAVQMYCGVLEGGPRRGRRPKAPPPPPPHPPQAPDGTDDGNDAHGRRITGAFIDTRGLRTWAAISGMSTSGISRTGSRRGAAGARSNWNTRCTCRAMRSWSTECIHRPQVREDPGAVVF
ncbi:predicted protein [Histoplasma mississippiense (nom. inval.)]|uniref:predicted protein n=1 Tax=Ajellomyces capsulatus (strain NAm1 / WU24) TaxID=2059318 RepID=UPI000157CFAC|nr:predicted protein [Histoplasma mississippiense (nom. inval.)]EDN10985.1 predicted protein [Histoplasma mississippiense (nom. inval.)]